MNGPSGPLDGWEIVASHGVTLLGRPGSGITGNYEATLSPVYELKTAMQAVQAGPNAPPQIGMVRMVQPVLTFASVKSLTVSGGIRIPVSSLSTTERRELARGVEACEQLLAQMRAGEAGVLLAPPGARVK